ncbi:MAG: type III-B CRISPR-associated protein Cas10/Cmr2, partial [Dehalococcoidia bacterium]|nr:type III-B CRISPR-associated protein Cas10/Cmr2 [Dehalococcoidia bacterium]
WTAIWQRQAPGPWEVYWAAAPLRDGTGEAAYANAYRVADRVLAATKRTRAFVQAEEPGLKDTLSGSRSALRLKARDARQYWADIAARVTAAKLRPYGRERLDTLGAVKRFSDLAEQTFLSTSSVATADFLVRARQAAPAALQTYRDAVQSLLGQHAYRVRSDADWPYDGDLFYLETLTSASLEDRYGLAGLTVAALEPARRELRALHAAAGGPPSPYYGIVVLDGDSMGERINELLKEDDPLTAHRDFSKCLARFVNAVIDIAPKHQAQPVYNGGDDVLALAPMAEAVPFARALAARFQEITGGTASAGIALAHHLSPLDAALRAARTAETLAKGVTGKNAVCLTVVKRSGETIEVRSPWKAMGSHFEDLIRLLRDGALAGRFVADVAVSVSALPEEDDLLRAELRRLLRRHRSPTHPDAPDPEAWAGQLAEWARALPAGGDDEGRAAEFARWVGAAAFVARGGGE